MNAVEARELGERIAVQVEAEQLERAYTLLAPVIAERIPFRHLDRIGEAIGAGAPPPPSVAYLRKANRLLELIADARTEGGWVVIASALWGQLDIDRAGTFDRCRTYIVAADVWYGADIFGERVPGPALVADFEPALDLLAPWREDVNRWVRRAVGVVVHFWAKRSRGAPELAGQAQALLDLLEPMFGEWDMDAVKGVGWGLKTLGRHYPGLVAAWLEEQVVHRQRRHRALLLRKALTYLPKENQTL